MSITRTAFARARLRAFMPHTYTRQSRVPLADTPGTLTVDESEDDWGEQAYDPALPPPVPNQPCRWMPTQTRGGEERRGDESGTDASGGQQIRWMPIMLVPIDDPIKAGDIVSNVALPFDPVTQQPRVLFAGTLKVSSVRDSPAGDAGSSVARRVHLSTAQEVV